MKMDVYNSSPVYAPLYLHNPKWVPTTNFHKANKKIFSHPLQVWYTYSKTKSTILFLSSFTPLCFKIVFTIRLFALYDFYTIPIIVFFCFSNTVFHNCSPWNIKLKLITACSFVMAHNKKETHICCVYQ